jgi:hypothetical protein
MTRKTSPVSHKQGKNTQKITTFLTFDDRAEEARKPLRLDLQEFEDPEHGP